MEEIPLKDKISLLRGTDLFSMFTRDELTLIADQSTCVSFNQGESVFRSGMRAEHLYIIRSGSVMIHRKSEGIDNYIAKYIEGDCFGELEMLQNSTRTADAIAETFTSVLVFPGTGSDFTNVLGSHPEISARILYKFITLVAERIRSTNRLISEKTPWIQELKNHLFYDKLTGIYNKKYLADDLMSRLLDGGLYTCILMIKPDNFKEINDSFGHQSGDCVLRKISETIKSSIRVKDIPVRYKGDEFAVILPDTDREGAKQVAQMIRSSINCLDLSDLLSGTSINITVSIGISVYPENGDSDLIVTEYAYMKMYEARNSGGDRIHE